MAKRTCLTRVNDSTLKKIRSALPNRTDPERFDILFGTSLVKVEGILKDVNFADNLGIAIYGKKLWKKQNR